MSEKREQPTVAQMAATARQLATDLFTSQADIMICSWQKHGQGGLTTAAHGQSCLQREEDRPLTRTEKEQGWMRRPFYAYHEANLCNSCRVYWMAELAAQDLHTLECWQIRIEAEDKRKAATTNETR